MELISSGSNNDMTFEDRLKHLKRGEGRVAEMERHVQCLRERLCRLEKLLPQDEAVSKTCTDVSSDTQSTDCPVDGLAKKEKSLRKQIHAMECTEQAYINQIAENKKKPIRSHEDVQKERLAVLESYGQKLCNNLQALNNNHAGLTQEARNLTQVLEKTRDRQKEMNNARGNCGCEILPKCNSCIICTCDDWERDLDSTKQSKDKSEYKYAADKDCSCREESSSSSDSEESCQCQHTKAKQKKNTKNFTCRVSEADSTSSDCYSSDDQTYCSDRSKCTCFCSRNHSHDDLSIIGKNKKVERCRGGLDMIEAKTTVVSLKQNDSQKNLFPPLSNAVVDRLKLLKVEDLREGLERLKIRNRNLKDFLQTLENPLALMNNKSSETICTDVSSCYTLDLARQSRSGLMTVIDVLEDKCRSKDAVILALADELKTNGGKKFHSSRKEKIWKSLDEEKRTGRVFTKKDSAIGFLIFLLILASHVKKSEMISYFFAVKKIITEVPFKLVLYVNETGKLLVDDLIVSYGKIAIATQKLVHTASVKWEDVNLCVGQTLGSFMARFDAYLHQCLLFVSSHEFHHYYLITGLSIVVVTFLIVKFWKSITANVKITSFKQIESFKSVAVRMTTFLKHIFLSIISSKVFWITLGFCSHILWSFLEDDISAYLHPNTKEIAEDNCWEMEISNDLYVWISLTSILAEKLQSLINYSCDLIDSVFRQ